MKSHLSDTISLDAEDGLYGSCVLNPSQCRLSVKALEDIAKKSSKRKWMLHFPTISSVRWEERFRKRMRTSAALPIGIVAREAELYPEVQDIIEYAVYHDCPIATGHLPREIAALVCEEVHRRGGRVLLTHPMHPLIGFRLEEVLAYAQCPNTFVEFTLLEMHRHPDARKALLEVFLRGARAAVCVTSDYGQVGSPSVTEGYRMFHDYLKECFPSTYEEVFCQLCWTNPLACFGL